MGNRFHGVFSLFLIFLAIVIGLIWIAQESASLAVLYGVIILASLPTMVYSFCSKCPCRLDACGHVYPGKLTRLLPQRKQGDYAIWDVIGFTVPFTVLLAFPQAWLRQGKVAWVAFWVLVVAGAAEARLFVCPSCKNEKCPIYIQEKK